MYLKIADSLIILHAYPGDRRAPKTGARAGPPLPRVGRVNQSCLTADIWFHSVIQYLSDQKGQHTAIDESGTEGGTESGTEGGTEGGV